MSAPETLNVLLKDFCGVVRLFPLPNLVMLPSVVQPLHIFEERYRAMLAEALASDRLLAMATLAPGWEENYDGRPRLGRYACLGKIVQHQALEDGSSNILLVGLSRVRLVEERENGQIFREAKVELCEDEYSPQGLAERDTLRDRLLEEFRTVMSDTPEFPALLDQIIPADVPLGMLSDVVGHTVGFSVNFKKWLLAETNVDRRAKQILKRLACSTDEPVTTLPESLGFPPRFSTN